MLASDYEPAPVLPRNEWVHHAHRRTDAHGGTDAYKLESFPKAQKDLHGYYARARALAELVTKAKTPMTIAISADWGRGKTTILNTVRFLLEKFVPEQPSHEAQRVHVLEYRPWHYRLESFEDVWVSLMAELQDQVDAQRANWGFSTEFLKVARLAKLVSAARFLGAGVGLVPGREWAEKASKLVLGLVSGDKECSTEFFEANRSAFGALAASAAPQGEARTLLIVDDLDRCSPAVAVDVLRAVHTLAHTQGAVCLLAMDRDVVLDHLSSVVGTASDASRRLEQAVQHLHKIIDLTVTPPRLETSRTQSFESAGEKKPPRLKDVESIQASDRWLPGEDLVEGDLFGLEKYLLYNPRALKRFSQVFDFRRSVLASERSELTEPEPLVTIAQAVIEVRWPHWNQIAYRHPEDERAFKLFARELALGWLHPSAEDAHAEELERRHPRLSPFLRDRELRRFYQDYFRRRAGQAKKSADNLASAASGRITLRGKPIQDLAKNGFLPTAAHLLGPDFKAAVGEALASEPWKALPSRPSVESMRVALNSSEREALSVDSVARFWSKAVLALVPPKKRPSASHAEALLRTFLRRSLVEPRATKRQVRAIDRHMALQIESPNSPSSLEVRRVFQLGGSLTDAVLAGIDRFWRADHGLASMNLALLLDDSERSPEVEVATILERGGRVPGFGSHEHKGAVGDPRLSLYEHLLERAREANPDQRYWSRADGFERSVAIARARAGKDPLPVNPDFAMALLHLDAGVELERIPWSFLVSRMLGWCAVCLELEKRRNGGAGPA